jgi:hypothetical protein
MNRLLTSAMIRSVAQLAWWEVREAQDSQNLPNSRNSRTNRKR